MVPQPGPTGGPPPVGYPMTMPQAVYSMPPCQPTYLYVGQQPNQFRQPQEEYQMRYHMQQQQQQQHQQQAQPQQMLMQQQPQQQQQHQPQQYTYAPVSYAPYTTYLTPSLMTTTSSSATYYPSAPLTLPSSGASILAAPTIVAAPPPPPLVVSSQLVVSTAPPQAPLSAAMSTPVSTPMSTPMLVGSKRKASMVSAASALTQDSLASSVAVDERARTRAKIEDVGGSAEGASPRASSPSPLTPSTPADRPVSVGSHAQMRRHKHKEVEVRRRRKISNLFNELGCLLECGPTDKASILAIAARYVRYAKEHGIRPSLVDQTQPGEDSAAADDQVVSPMQNSNYSWRSMQTNQQPQPQPQQQQQQPSPPMGHLFPQASGAHAHPHTPIHISMPMHPMVPLPTHSQTTSTVMLTQPHLPSATRTNTDGRARAMTPLSQTSASAATTQITRSPSVGSPMPSAMGTPASAATVAAAAAAAAALIDTTTVAT